MTDTESPAGTVEFDGITYTLTLTDKGRLDVWREGERVGYFWPHELAMPVPIATWEPAFLSLPGVAERAWELRGAIVAAYRSQHPHTQDSQR